MTLGDLLRRYLDDRRKLWENRAKSSKFINEPQLFSKQCEDVSSEKSSKLFSNTLQKKPKNECKTCKSYQASMTSKVVTRPNGNTQVETVIKDGQGNEEKHVVYQEGNKKFTTITRKDSSGNEKIEQKVEDINVPSNFGNSGTMLPDHYFGTYQNSDDGYDFWFNKFFRPENDQREITPDLNNFEKNIENLFKGFNDDPFSSKFKNYPSNGIGSYMKKFNHPEFFPQEERRLIDQFADDQSHKFQNNPEDFQARLNKVFNNFIEPKSSLFEKFAERVDVMVPDEETPLDKFIKPSEKNSKLRESILEDTAEMIKKIDELDKNSQAGLNNAVYSDIQQPENEIALTLPRSQLVPFFPNITDLMKAFGSMDVNMTGTTTSKVVFSNGNSRTVTMKQDSTGNMEKSITYKSGNKSYNVVMITSPSGQLLDKKREFNFSENDLPKFRKEWQAMFQSDFDD